MSFGDSRNRAVILVIENQTPITERKLCMLVTNSTIGEVIERQIFRRDQRRHHTTTSTFGATPHYKGFRSLLHEAV